MASKNKSTATFGIQMQSLKARALDGGDHVSLASLNLSSAFDVVNIGLLLERMRVIGLPPDLIDLVGLVI